MSNPEPKANQINSEIMKGNGEMVKRIQRASDNPYNLSRMAKSCSLMLGDDGRDAVDGEMQSCPAPIEAELRSLIGKHPNINTVTDASLVVAEVGTKMIMDMVQGHKPGKSTPCLTDEVLSLEPLLAGGEHFKVLPLYPTCKLSYRLCCACYAELQSIQADLKLPLDEVIKMVLVAGLAHATEWIPKSRRDIFRRELRRLHDWAVLRLRSPGTEAA